MTNPFALDRANKGHQRVLKRHRREQRFRVYGWLAVACSCAFLGVLLVTIVGKGWPALYQTQFALPVTFEASVLDPKGKVADGVLDSLETASYSKLVKAALKARFPEVTDRREKIELYGLLSKSAEGVVRQAVLDDPALVGKTETLWLPAASSLDMAVKGNILRETPAHQRRVSDRQFGWLDALGQDGAVRSAFNTRFFTSGDSREPEMAGILGSLVGSLFVIVVCVALAFPLGVGAAVYLEEFAPKNKLTDMIEVNVNNLAAVPSIVYGLLALAVFLNGFNLPRSSALVGGLALSLLVMPIIIVATRNALKSVPPSIKDAAVGLGASPMQALFHHTLPLAMPGIMTGTILSIARALGETAPLLMIGMVAFVVDVPSAITDPSTALPVQVYLWADSPEQGFIEKTSAAIMILLALLVCINLVAVWLRKRFEYRW